MGKQRNAKLTKELEEELLDKLQDLLDEADAAVDKKKAVAEILSGHVKALRGSVALVRRQLKGQDLEQLQIPGTEKPAPKNDPLVRRILEAAGGIVDRKEAEQEKEAEAKKAAAEVKRAEAEVPELSFTNGTDLMVAVVLEGEYHLERTADGDFTVRWAPYKGRGKILATHLNAGDGKKLCRQHQLEQLADAKLKNAGDGSMTKGDLKGPPEKRK